MSESRKAFDDYWASLNAKCETLAQEITEGPKSLSYTHPNFSDAMAVHPDQIQEAEESAKRRGVPTEFLRDGRAVFTSRAHQKAYLKAYGKHNRDGGYGD